MTINDMKEIFSHIPEEYHDKKFVVRIEYEGDDDKVLLMDYGFDSLKYDRDTDEVLILIKLMEEAEMLTSFNKQKRESMN